MKGLEFVEGIKGINAYEFMYLKKMFNLLKVGVEFEFEFDSEPSYSEIERELGGVGGDFTSFNFNTTGVNNVHSDGSLDEGCEIVTNGRLLLDPYLHYLQYKRIFDAVNWEHEMNPRTGLHQHFIIATGKNTNLEKPLNLLFIKNLTIIFKKYLLEMIYLTSANYKEGVGFTRYSGFSKYERLYESNFNTKNTFDDIRNAVNGGDRYQCLNYNSMGVRNVDRVNVVDNFHVEFRLADGALCPSQVVIQNFLYKAIIDLALESTLLGEVLDEGYADKRDLLRKFKNNPSGNQFPDGNRRYSNNTLVVSEENRIKEYCYSFIELLEPYMEKNIVLGLKSLTERPIGLKIGIDGLTFQDLDNELNQFEKTISGNLDSSILKTVLSIDNISSLDSALIASKESGCNLEEINNTLNILKEIGEFGGKKWR